MESSLTTKQEQSLYLGRYRSPAGLGKYSTLRTDLKFNDIRTLLPVIEFAHVDDVRNEIRSIIATNANGEISNGDFYIREITENGYIQLESMNNNKKVKDMLQCFLYSDGGDTHTVFYYDWATRMVFKSIASHMHHRGAGPKPTQKDQAKIFYIGKTVGDKHIDLGVGDGRSIGVHIDPLPDLSCPSGHVNSHDFGVGLIPKTYKHEFKRTFLKRKMNKVV